MNHDSVDGGATVAPSPLSVFDTDSASELREFTDFMFTGEVVKEPGEDVRPSLVPVTRFEVDVRRVVKGEPTDTVVVQQQLGHEKRGEAFRLQGDDTVKTGRVYFFGGLVAEYARPTG